MRGRRYSSVHPPTTLKSISINNFTIYEIKSPIDKLICYMIAKLQRKKTFIMKNNSTLLVVGALVIIASAVGYWVYQDQQKAGIDITVGGSGITVRER